jgi:hypothetical protein
MINAAATLASTRLHRFVWVWVWVWVWVCVRARKCPSSFAYVESHSLHPLTHSPTHPLSHSLTHPLTHSLTHPLTQATDPATRVSAAATH